MHYVGAGISAIFVFLYSTPSEPLFYHKKAILYWFYLILSIGKPLHLWIDMQAYFFFQLPHFNLNLEKKKTSIFSQSPRTRTGTTVIMSGRGGKLVITTTAIITSIYFGINFWKPIIMYVISQDINFFDF